METWDIMDGEGWSGGSQGRECGFLHAAQIGRGGGFTLDGGVFPLSGIKAEVFLLLFNRRLRPFRDEKIVKKQNPIRSFITGQEPMNRPVCPDVSFYD